MFVFIAVVGAPLAEEFFFRGLVQRSLERYGGRVGGLLAANALFALGHYTGAGLKATIVTVVSISVAGLVFGALASVTRRLGPSVIAHMTFNSIVVALNVFS